MFPFLVFPLTFLDHPRHKGAGTESEYREEWARGWKDQGGWRSGSQLIRARRLAAAIFHHPELAHLLVGFSRRRSWSSRSMLCGDGYTSGGQNARESELPFPCAAQECSKSQMSRGGCLAHLEDLLNLPFLKFYFMELFTALFGCIRSPLRQTGPWLHAVRTFR